jgi:hypothetical protein
MPGNCILYPRGLFRGVLGWCEDGLENLVRGSLLELVGLGGGGRNDCLRMLRLVGVGGMLRLGYFYSYLLG